MNTNLSSPAQVRLLLARHGVFPKKRLGQNFLVDHNTLENLVRAMDLAPGDLVLEVGAGIGTATLALAESASKVIAIEIDDALIPILRETLADRPNVEILQADFLKLNLPALIKEHSTSGKVKVFANLPYYITSPIIARLIEFRDLVDLTVLMTQREVADRLIAKPGTADYGSLSVLVQFYVRLESIAQVSRSVFLPSPTVDSTALRMTPLEKPSVQVKDEKLFFHIVRAGFGKRRKTLENALAGHSGIGLEKAEIGTALRAAGIDPMRRGETLDLKEIARLSDAIGEARGK